MGEQLGKIEKPSVEEYTKGRLLLFVPLVIVPADVESELLDKVSRYWEQVEAQVVGLETKLGSVKQIYHELLPLGGEEGAKAIEEISHGSHNMARARLDKGALLEQIEDAELLAEFMDWSRCLSIGLQSQNVLTRIYEFFSEANKRRNEHIAKRIGETLKENEVGILVMREGHQVQFPQDIRVFYVAPPGLDEIKRWLREKASIEERAAGA